jgi:Na+-driven multidrug efflux pump
VKKELLIKGFPVFVTHILGSIINLLNLHVISLLYSTHILSAYGLGSSLYLTYISLLNGLTAGTISYLADRVNRKENFSFPTSLIMGVLLSLIIIIFSVPIEMYYFSKIAPIKDLQVASEVKTYLNIVRWSLPFSAITTVCSGYIIFNGQNFQLLKYSAISFSLTLIPILSNVFWISSKPLVLIGLAILASSLISSYLLARFVLHNIAKTRINFTEVDFIEGLRSLKISLYSGGQVLTLVTTSAILLIFCSQISNEAVGIMAVLMNINRTFILPSKSFGTTVGAIAARKFALKNSREANLALKNGIELVCFLVAPISLLLIFLPETTLTFFLPTISLDPHQLLAVKVAGLSLLFEPLTGFLSNALKTQGMTQSIFYCTLYQWIVVLPLSWYGSVNLGYGLLPIWLCILSFRIVFSVCCLTIWKHHASNKMVGL